jgi:predicted XRE-type DNA-binding protein
MCDPSARGPVRDWPSLVYGAKGETDPAAKPMNMKTKRRSTRKTNVTEGSGNVFSDLGLPDADQELMKARLTLQIYRIIKDRGLSQTEAGKILGIPQPHVSAPARNRSGNFSVARLLDFLTALGQDVEITVRSTRKDHGAMSVVVI